MKKLFLLLLICPVLVSAQINRSAAEVAKERIAEYIVTKLYPGADYRPLLFGNLAVRQLPHSDITWVLTHRFEITESRLVNDRKTTVARPVYFSFYLDKKMKVVGAESFEREGLAY